MSYANEIKSQWLGVREDTLIKYGAVSQDCVVEMLQGIIKMADANGAIAISGIAGPLGGTDEKPVGTVYIGIIYNDKITIEHHLFKGDRESIQEQATVSAISLFKKKL